MTRNTNSLTSARSSVEPIKGLRLLRIAEIPITGSTHRKMDPKINILPNRTSNGKLAFQNNIINGEIESIVD